MNKPRISYLAIASLVTGMMFFIPIVSGVAATIFGSIAIRSINKSEGLLLGKGLAYSGVSLGLVHGIFWLLVFYAGLTYTVDVTKSAVVIRNGEVNRVEELGVHYKIPFIESVEYFPTQAIQKLESNTGKLLFNTREFDSTSYILLWRVCSPKHAYEKFREFQLPLMEQRLTIEVISELRMAAVYKSDLIELISDFTVIKSIEEKLNEELSKWGICVISLTLKSE